MYRDICAVVLLLYSGKQEQLVPYSSTAVPTQPQGRGGGGGMKHTTESEAVFGGTAAFFSLRRRKRVHP